MPPPDLLSQYLADRDEPCPSCGYSLRALQTDRCPECNQALVLQVRLAEPRLAAFIAVIAAASAGVGFNGLLFAFFLLEVSRRGSPRLHQWISLPIFAVMCGGILWWAVTHRGLITRLPDSSRFALAAGAWFITITSAVVFFSAIR